MIPGTSRAGVIITGARLFKLSRVQAAKLGLFTGIPTIAGAVILEGSWLLSNYTHDNIINLIFIILLSEGLH